MRAALDALQGMSAPKKIAILGDMLELGAESQKEHEAILRFAARLKLDHLVAVGPVFAGCDPARYQAIFLPNAQAAKEWFERQAFDGALVLIKASRGIGLERVVKK
jgi:UDP-N-acetylmuramoyl-tripeptide--D-alanyl-D-alanine ligase